MSRIGPSLLVLAIAGSLLGGNAFAQTPSVKKANMESDRNVKKSECLKQVKQKQNLSKAEKKAFVDACEGPKPN
jgi:hypothetical protein